MHTRFHLLFLAFTLMMPGSPAYAGYEEGVQAADRGDYATAIKEWQPLADQGDPRAQFRIGLSYDNGEGVAGFREKIATGYSELRKKLIDDGVDPETADRFMEEAMRLDTMRDIGEKGNMVIVTTDSGSARNLGELQALGATLNRKPAGEQNNAQPHRTHAPVAAPGV